MKRWIIPFKKFGMVRVNFMYKYLLIKENNYIYLDYTDDSETY